MMIGSVMFEYYDEYLREDHHVNPALTNEKLIDEQCGDYLSLPDLLSRNHC